MTRANPATSDRTLKLPFLAAVPEEEPPLPGDKGSDTPSKREKPYEGPDHGQNRPHEDPEVDEDSP